MVIGSIIDVKHGFSISDPRNRDNNKVAKKKPPIKGGKRLLCKCLAGALAGYHHDHRLGQNPQIGKNRPATDILQVVLHFAIHARQ